MENPYELFQKELPELAGKFNELVEAQISLKGLDPKTKQLINIAIQTANRIPRELRCTQSWQKRSEQPGKK